MKYSDMSRIKVDTKGHRYPFSVVWTPLPLISALFPFIGHTGICTSEGIIHDFSGPFCVTVDSMAFGDPTKYVQLQNTPADWDQAVSEGDDRYNQEMHNLCCNNCHSHVAYVLNQCQFEGGGWNMFSVWWICISRSKYTGMYGFFKTYIGFAIVVAIVVLFTTLTSK